MTPFLVAPERDLAHPASADESWQESLAFYWLDEQQGIGGAHRLARQVVAGLANLQTGLADHAGRRYRRAIADIPAADGDGADRLSASHSCVTLSEHGLLLDIDEPGCRASLTFVDAAPAQVYPGEHPSVDRTAPAHYEGSGQMSGWVEAFDERIEVEGLYCRDHSWGPRDWSWVRSHRWVAGRLGSGVSFSIFTVHDREGGYHAGGFLQRGEEVLAVRDVDVTAHVSADGLTHRGGVVTGVTADGPFTLECRSFDTFVWGPGALTFVDGLSTVSSELGRGFCCFEISNNPHGGTAPATLALDGVLDDGVSVR
jgi:hypothetical protein